MSEIYSKHQGHNPECTTCTVLGIEEDRDDCGCLKDDVDTHWCAVCNTTTITSVLTHVFFKAVF